MRELNFLPPRQETKIPAVLAIVLGLIAALGAVLYLYWYPQAVKAILPLLFAGFGTGVAGVGFRALGWKITGGLLMTVGVVLMALGLGIYVVVRYLSG